MAEISTQLKRFLKTANSSWREHAARAKEKTGFERLEDGRYVTRLTGAELGEARGSGRPQVVWTYTVIEGDEKGQTVKGFRGLDNDENFEWFGRELMVYGVDPEDVIWDEKQSKDDAFILNVLDALADAKPVVKLRLQTKGEFQNVNVEGRIDDYEGDEDEPEPKVDAKKNGKAPKVEEPEEVVEDDEEEVPEEVPEEVEVEVERQVEIGSVVAFDWGSEKFEGIVRDILEDDGILKVIVGNKIYPVKEKNNPVLVDAKD